MSKKKRKPDASAASLASVRSRILGHCKVKASDLVPNAGNWRMHPESQRQALRGVLGEVGFARSALAYVADADRHLGEAAPLTLLDGHLRREELGDQLIDVEVLDVDDAEAKLILATIDPLASMATADAEKLEELLGELSVESPELQAMLDELGKDAGIGEEERQGAEPDAEVAPASVITFEVIVTCESGTKQEALFERLKGEGLVCRLERY